MSYNKLHQAQCHDLLRSWQSQRTHINHHEDFVLPLFIINDDNAIEVIESMPGVFRYGCNRVIEYLEPLVYSFGLRAVLLFPVIYKETPHSKSLIQKYRVSDDSDDDKAAGEDTDSETISSSDCSSSRSSSSESSLSSSDEAGIVALTEKKLEDKSQNPFLNQNEEEEDHLLENEPSSNHPVQGAVEKISTLVDSSLIELFGLNDEHNPVLRLIPILKAKFPNLLIICDVCLCTFTLTGHCCIFKKCSIQVTHHRSNTLSSRLEKPTTLNLDQPVVESTTASTITEPADRLPSIDNKLTCRYLSKLALEYATRGCHVIAPSDMMDNRVSEIRKRLDDNKLHDISIMSYSSKFASTFYGPFRQAAQSSPQFGNRKAYQLPPGSRSLALRAVDRDIREGADIVMVKPGGPYLDIIRDIKETYPLIPLAVYQVSGEYSMLKLAAKANLLDLKIAVNEMLTAFRRAGANIIITYFTPELLRGEL